MDNHPRPFDEFEIDLDGAHPPSVSTYQFLGRSSNPLDERVRVHIQDWAGHVPGYAYNEWLKAFRARNHNDFFFELALHEYLYRVGARPEMTQPGGDRPPRPDFVCKLKGQEFAIEATCCGWSNSTHVSPYSETVLHELQKLNGSYLRVSLDLEQEPKQQPSPSKIARLMLDKVGELESLPDPVGQWFVIEERGCRYVFEVISKSSNATDPILSAVIPNARRVPSGPLSNAIRSKAKKYPNYTKPLIIAVNNYERMTDLEEVFDALLGSSTCNCSSRETYRASDGILGTPTSPSALNVCGILMTDHLTAMNISLSRPVYIEHPWTEKPLGVELPSIETWRLVGEKFERVSEGKSLCQLLGATDLIE